MEFSGQYQISAPIDRVWTALNDPAVLQTCIAGCKQLDKVSDTEFSAIVAARVGPVSATFRGTVVLSDLDPPHGYTLTGQGQGGAAGFAKMRASVALSEVAGGTLLRYTAQADIGGKLASIGSRLVQTVAKKNADDFFDAFARRLGGQPPAAQGIAAPGVPASPPPAPHGTPDTPRPTGMASLVRLVPAWLVVFSCGVGFAFGYVVGHLH